MAFTRARKKHIAEHGDDDEGLIREEGITPASGGPGLEVESRTFLP